MEALSEAERSETTAKRKRKALLKDSVKGWGAMPRNLRITQALKGLSFWGYERVKQVDNTEIIGNIVTL